MTTIGFATLQIIPSLKGVSEEINKQLGNKLGPLGKLGGAQLGKGVAAGLKSTEGDVKRAADAYGKLADKAKDSLGKVRVEEEKLAKARSAGKADMIVAAEERLAKARRDSLRSTKEAEAAHSALGAAQKSLAGGSDNLGGKLSALDGVAAKLGPALAAVGAAAAGAAVAGVAALGAAAVVAGRELYELGAAFDDISDTLRIKTGATGATLDALNKSVLNIGKSVPVALGDLGAIVAETNRNLHLTGPALDDVAGSVANLGRLTGEAVDMRGLGKAFRGFGVDAKDMTPALDSLYQASQRSGIGVNELVAAVNKGAPALRQLGLSFGESAALAAQFEEIGLDPDKGMAGLAKGVATLAKETGQTGKQALQGFLDQVRQLATVDQAGALNLSNKMFGAKGGALFFDAIKSGALDLDTLSASLAGTGDTIAQASVGTADWAEKWQLLKNNTETSLKPLGDAVFEFVNAKLTLLSDWVLTHQDEIIDFFVGVGKAAVTMAEVAVHAVGDLVAGLGELIQPLGDVHGASLRLMAATKRLFGDTELADELDAQADAAFGWGEELEAVGKKMREFNGDHLREELDGVGAAAKASGDNLDGLRAKIEAVPQSDRGWFDFSGNNTGGGSNTGGGGVRPSSNTGGGFNWDAVADKESSGNWQNDNTGGHMTSSGAPRGGLQITDGTWKAFGGTEFAPTANLATKEQQIAVAERIAWEGYKGTKPQGLGAWEVITKGMVPGVTVNTPRGGTTGGGGSSAGATNTSGIGPGKTTAGIDQLAAIVAEKYPGVNLGGWRPSDGPNTPTGHQRGIALDIGIGQDQALGDTINTWLRANFEQLGVKSTIWRDQWADFAGNKSNVPGHQDHVHVEVNGQESLSAVTGPGSPMSSPFDFSRNTLGATGTKEDPMYVTAAESEAGNAKSSSAAGFKMPSSFSGIGSALGEFAGGQIGSALGVFGVPDSPAWLQGVSQLVGGISVGGQGGGAWPGMGDMHGGTGAQPGPGGVTYNIAARDTEDAFIRAQRQERERAAARLSRY